MKQRPLKILLEQDTPGFPALPVVPAHVWPPKRGPHRPSKNRTFFTAVLVQVPQVLGFSDSKMD